MKTYTIKLIRKGWELKKDAGNIDWIKDIKDDKSYVLIMKIEGFRAYLRALWGVIMGYEFVFTNDYEEN